MEIIFTILYHELVVRDDIPRLSHEWRRRVKHSIEKKLTSKPDAYGKPLRRSLAGYRKLRVGDYRVIFRIERVAVKIFVIEHRSVAYRIAGERVAS